MDTGQHASGHPIPSGLRATTLVNRSTWKRASILSGVPTKCPSHNFPSEGCLLAFAKSSLTTINMVFITERSEWGFTGTTERRASGGNIQVGVGGATAMPILERCRRTISGIIRKLRRTKAK